MDASADSLLGKIICEDTLEELLRRGEATGVYRSLTPEKWQRTEPQNAPEEKQTDPTLETPVLTPKRQGQIPFVATRPVRPSPDQSSTHEAVRPGPQGGSLNRQQQQEEGKKQAAKSSKLIVSSEIHLEIATMAARIQQLKERLLAQSNELRQTSSPCASENPVEEESFPAWLN
jgi:hypothetical protein